MISGRGTTQYHSQRPVDDRLFFAGEATVTGGQGTCHGAYESGIQAAREIAGVLEGGA